MRDIIISALTVTAIMCISSCKLEQEDPDSHSHEMGIFSNSLAGDIIVTPVLLMSECFLDTVDIFKPGYETTIGGHHIKLLSAEDSIWSVSNAVTTDQLTFSSTVKMLPEDSATGLPQWQCTGEGSYIENIAYMATLETVTPAVMIWRESRTTTSLSYDLCMSGTFRITTFLRSTGQSLDRCRIIYDKTDVGDRNYTLEMESVYVDR